MGTAEIRWDRTLRVLDFDIENRPLSYLGHDWTTAEVTAIAAQFIEEHNTHCWLLGAHTTREMLDGFRALYDEADMVTGHYIRKHDLPILNGAYIECAMPPLGPKLAHDTKLDLRQRRDFSASQENLAAVLGVEAPKIGMSQVKWREANRLTPEGIALTKERVVGDVRQHIQLRARLLELGWLRAPKMWSPA